MAATTFESAGVNGMKHRLSHTGVVASFHISANYVIIGLDDGYIHIFSQAQNKIVNVLKHDRAVWALDVWDETSTLVAGGTGGELKVWHLATDAKPRSLSGHTNTVRCLQLLSQGTRALSASRDSTLRLWDLQSGTCERVLEGHTKTIREIAVWREVAVSASYDDEARVWDVRKGDGGEGGEGKGDGEERCLHVLRGHEGHLYAVAFEGEKIATGGLGAEVRVWNLEGGENLAVLRGHTGLVGHLIIVGDELISSSTDGTVRIWSLNNYTELRCIRAHKGAITALACDGTRILSGGADGDVKMWDFETGELVRGLETGMDAVWKGGFLGDKAVAVYHSHGSAVMEFWNLIANVD